MPLEKESLNNFLPKGFETLNQEGYKENFNEDKIATGFERDVPDIVSGPNLNNLLDNIGKNTNVLTKFMDFIKNMPINNLFAVDENNQLVYKNLDEVGGGGLEIGDIGIAPLGIDETKNKRRYLNGQIIIQEQFLNFTTKLKTAINLYPTLSCSEEEWQATALLTVGGQVGKFVVDDDAGTIRLPKIIMPIQGLTDLSKLAEIVEAGLPKPTSDRLIDYVGTGGSGQLSSGATAKAVSPNPIYGKSNTVQQEQIQYPYFIQVATGAETKDDIINEHELVNPYILLEPKFFETPVYNLSWLISNGSFTGSKAVHPHAYDALLIELNADIEVGTTQNNYTKRGLPVKLATDSYTDYDFVVNPANETFRPPLKVNLASSKAVVGNGMSSGFTSNGSNLFSIARSGNPNDTNASWRDGVHKLPYVYSKFAGTGSVNAYLGITTDPTKSGIETSDSNLYLYFYVGEVAQNTNLVNAGRIEEIKANKTDVDGQWVGIQVTLANSVNYPTKTDLVYDISEYLPNDGCMYEVILAGRTTTGATSGNNIKIVIDTDIIKNTSIIGGGTRANGAIANYATSIIPTRNRLITVKADTGSSVVGTFMLYLRGYRRLGNNV